MSARFGVQTSLPFGSCAVASPARISVPPASELASTAPAPDCGSSSDVSSKSSRRKVSSSRTFEDSLGGHWTPLSPGSATSVTRWRAPSSEPPTSAPPTSGLAPSSSPWPTPDASDAGSNQGGAAGRTAHAGTSLTDAVRGDGATGRIPTRGGPSTGSPSVLWPTPMAGDGKMSGAGQVREGGPCLSEAAGRGPLNPQWVESLMGFVQDWTALDPEASGRVRAEVRAASMAKRAISPRSTAGKRREPQSE